MAASSMYHASKGQDAPSHRYVLHPGMPKTGTTSIQRAVWGRLPNYAGWRPWRVPGLGDQIRDLVQSRREPDYEAVRRSLETARWLPQLPVTLSYESFTWQTFATADTAMYRLPASVRAERAHRLLGEDTFVVITCREQRSWLVSTYKFLLTLGLPLTFDEFLARQTELIEAYEGGGADLWRTHEIYAGCFSSSNVRTVPLESLTDPGGLGWPLLFEAWPHARVGPLELPHDRPGALAGGALPPGAMRSLNALSKRGYGSTSSARGPLARRLSARRIPVIERRQHERLVQRAEEFVAGCTAIAESNRALADASGLPLGDYGYVL